jgi:hypothetical protein
MEFISKVTHLTLDLGYLLEANQLFITFLEQQDGDPTLLADQQH